MTHLERNNDKTQPHVEVIEGVLLGWYHGQKDELQAEQWDEDEGCTGCSSHTHRSWIGRVGVHDGQDDAQHVDQEDCNKRNC